MKEDKRAQAKEPKPPRYVWLISTLAERWAAVFRGDSLGRGTRAAWTFASDHPAHIYQLCTGCGRPLELNERHIFWQDPSYSTGYGEDGHAHLLCAECVKAMYEELTKPGLPCPSA